MFSLRITKNSTMSLLSEHSALRLSQILTNYMQLKKEDQNRKPISTFLWRVPYLRVLIGLFLLLW